MILNCTCLGGYSDSNDNGEADGSIINSCFSLTNFIWAASTPMLSTRSYAAVVLLPDNTIMVSGGLADGPTTIGYLI